MEAEKIKKKLNGAILTGSKMRVEKARPAKNAKVGETDDPEIPKKPKKDSRKRKRGDDVIVGAEIGERSVKRGWTTPVATKSHDKELEKKKIKSKYTTGAELLFKTVVPPNVATASKAKEKPEKKKRSKPGKEAVVHEFSKTTRYPTFLKSTSSSNSKVSVEFIEGKGWVDEEGNVVDEVVKKSRKAAVVVEPKKTKKKEPTPEPVVEEESSSSDGDSSNGTDSSEQDSKLAPASQAVNSSEHATAVTSVPEPMAKDTDTSSSGSSSSDSDSESDNSEDSSNESGSVEAASSLVSEDEAIDSRPVSQPQSASGGPPNLMIKIPSPPSATEIHPLEALYKRPKTGAEAAPKSNAESFSFFGTDNPDIDSEAEEATDKVPLTPFTQRDFEYRGLRSAAPTPDTAHANKRFVWPTSQDGEEDDIPSSPIHGKGESSKVSAKGKEKEALGKEKGEEESDFQKWFYEHRGETTRAWKKRRRVVGKEKRHRENKKRSDRAI